MSGSKAFSASVFTRGRGAPLSWLDPGVFGTLGVGGGFTVGAAAYRPGAEVWLIYGDGSSAYSLAASSAAAVPIWLSAHAALVRTESFSSFARMPLKKFLT